MPSENSGLKFLERKVAGHPVPTIVFTDDSRPSLSVGVVKGVIINSVVNGEKDRERQQVWKAQVASAVKAKRGPQPWNSADKYAITLVLRFHMGNHGNQDFDVDNFVKPIIDAIAAGLFCPNSTEPQNIKRWCYDDSNFNTLLIHRLPDTRTRAGEGIAISVSARSAV